jgi:hypothetical protein
MSTNSRIAIQNPDLTVSSVYCHWDGYPEWNGQMLKNHYSDRAKLESLIGLGDLSYIAESVAPAPGQEHSFERPADGVTVAYHRDRGEALRSPRLDRSLEAFTKGLSEQWGYVYTLNDEWVVVRG